GNVIDSTRAAIVGAKVTVVNNQTNLTRETVTNEAGGYSFPTVATGTFTLTATAPGFQTFVQNNISVAPNSVTRVNITLEVGQVTETVTVEASAATLQTDRAEVRQEVTEKSLKELPVPLGRNYQMLFVTLPGFSPPRNAHSIPSNPSRSVQFSVNGTSRSNNNTRIDGASSTNIWLPHMTGYLPALESIESVNAVTNSMDAEQGLAGGAAINVAIKSGSNDFHGSAFEYHSDQKIKAYPWNDPRTDRKAKFIDNQFGGTIGGPIKKDKIFFFVSYEGRRESEFRNRIGSVPTAEMRQGDLSLALAPCGATQNCNVYDPATGMPDGTGRQPFANNMIPQARFDLAAREILNTGDWGLPNLVGSGDFG
ncbi:MAG TPA: carboxypeptidase-like regulatory domain-containing protein, partial [candidate division Zixibacteria bacterium]|nr:carboxypeptidase-like regulatory domain-containing protein [candidate division Zixibacteria bacterium]